MNDNDDNFRLTKPKPRSKKLRPKTDLTAMVSVSFLLIIFFMVTKELAKPQAMDFGAPERGCGSDDGMITCGVWPTRVVTLLLDDDNKIISYRGMLEYPDQKPQKIGYGKDGIRRELISAKKKILHDTGNNNRGVIVIIKPSKKCNYGNLVDVLDEMAITQIGTYAVVHEFTPEESKLLASN